MRYELDYFQQLIHNEFSKGPKSVNGSISGLEARAEEISRETAAVQDRMFHFSYQLPHAEMGRYIAQQQQGIIHLSDRLVRCLDADQVVSLGEIDEAKTRLNCCKLVYAAFEELLGFIERFFQGFYNQDALIPLAYRIMAERQMERQLAAVSKGLLQRGVPAKFVELALSPVHCFLNNPAKKQISFRCLIYLRELLHELELIAGGEKAPAEDSLFELLCYLNFNSHGFYDHVVARCKKELELAGSRPEYLVRVAWLAKKVRQFSIKADVVLWPSRPGIREQVLGWLQSEHGYSRTQHREQLPQSEGPRYKLPLNLTVGQIGYFLRLMVKCGLLAEPQLTVIFDFIASHFLAKGGATISANGLRARYKDPATYSISAVRDFLFQMVREKVVC